MKILTILRHQLNEKLIASLMRKLRDEERVILNKNRLDPSNIIRLKYNQYMIELEVNIIGCLIIFAVIVLFGWYVTHQHDTSNKENVQLYILDQTCCICLDEKHHEMFLQCGHSFCRDCLFRMHQDEDDQPLCCPLCRRLATFMFQANGNEDDEQLRNYNKNFRDWKNPKRKWRKYGMKGLKLIALSPFLSILFLRIAQVFIGIAYIMYFILQPLFYYVLHPLILNGIQYVQEMSQSSAIHDIVI